jgi:hypothetical protein
MPNRGRNQWCQFRCCSADNVKFGTRCEGTGVVADFEEDETICMECGKPTRRVEIDCLQFEDKQRFIKALMGNPFGGLIR